MMKIIAGTHEIPIVMTIGRTEYIDGVQRQILEIWTDEPLTADETAALEQDWSIENESGDVIPQYGYNDIVRHSTWVAQVDANMARVRQQDDEIAALTAEKAAMQQDRDAAKAKVSDMLDTISDNISTNYSKTLATFYPSWDELVAKGDKIIAQTTRVIRHGEDANGNPQLYRVILDTVPTAEMTPDKIATNFDPVGIGSSGYPLWTKPVWDLDAYKVGDKVEQEDVVYVNEVEKNYKEPGTEDSGWVLNENENPSEEDTPVTEEPVEEPVTEEPPAEEPVEYNLNGTVRWDEWVDPKGIMTAYYGYGDGVTFEGARKVSDKDFNGDRPDVATSWIDPPKGK
jgi:hypothetical protein